MRLILASNSPRRRELLQQVGLDFQVIPSDCEEICTLEKPEALVEELARQKAENVAGKLAEKIRNGEDLSQKVQGAGNLSQKVQNVEDLPGNSREENGEELVTLGADTVVALDGGILGKPEDEEDAFHMIQSLQGRAHQVYSGVALIALSMRTGEVVSEKTFHGRTEVEVVPMTGEEIRAYIATGEPMDKAGAYGIQGRFAAYIEGIGGDYCNVVGLPISRLVRELRMIGK